MKFAHFIPPRPLLPLCAPWSAVLISEHQRLRDFLRLNAAEVHALLFQKCSFTFIVLLVAIPPPHWAERSGDLYFFIRNTAAPGIIYLK